MKENRRSKHEWRHREGAGAAWWSSLQSAEEALAALRARVAAAAAAIHAASPAPPPPPPPPPPPHLGDSFEAGTSAAGMIPEPEMCRGGRGGRGGPGGSPPPPPPPMPQAPLAQLGPDGLIMPRKLVNPCLDSADHKNLRRELLFNQRVGRNVLNQKSELQKAFGRQKELQQRKQQEQLRDKSDFERIVEERARRMGLLDKERSEEEKCSHSESEFLLVHAKMRARMDSK